MANETIKLEVGLEIINSYKRLSYKQWYALAEFIDNSTQAYFNNQADLDLVYAKENSKLTVELKVEKTGHETRISIIDNSMGMSFEELEHAVVIGKPPLNKNGRSKYGLGMKTASFWLGDEWTVITKKLHETEEHTVVINTTNLINTNGQLDYSKRGGRLPDEHYTKVIISNVHQPFTPSVINKVENHIKSMYRYDIINKDIIIKWNDVELEWNYEEVFDKLKPFEDSDNGRLPFEFLVSNKLVTGWAGVLEEGSRSKAGFSILMNNRVIKGWPNSYKPAAIFGEGGRNDLINQRLVGELFLDGFQVSHTKDEVIFEEDEEDILESNLREATSRLNVLVNQPKKVIKLSSEDEESIMHAISQLELEFSSPVLSAAYETFEVPDEELYELNKEVLIKSSSAKSSPKFNVKLGSLTVLVYLDDSMSSFEPYLSIGIYVDVDTVKVLINTNHPHWQQLNITEVIMNYIRHCVYDGVAEYKAYKYSPEEVKPDTIKSIKDVLLRASYKLRMD